jgi:hypothetical protein
MLGQYFTVHLYRYLYDSKSTRYIRVRIPGIMCSGVVYSYISIIASTVLERLQDIRASGRSWTSSRCAQITGTFLISSRTVGGWSITFSFGLRFTHVRSLHRLPVPRGTGVVVNASAGIHPYRYVFAYRDLSLVAWDRIPGLCRKCAH